MGDRDAVGLGRGGLGHGARELLVGHAFEHALGHLDVLHQEGRGVLDIAPSRIRVVRGQTQRNKLVRISGPVVLPPAIFHDGAANGL